MAASQPAPVILVKGRDGWVHSQRKIDVEIRYTDRGLDHGASGMEGGCQAGPNHGMGRGLKKLSYSGGATEVRTSLHSKSLSPSSHGETLGFHDLTSCGIKIDLVERACGFGWASSRCWGGTVKGDIRSFAQVVKVSHAPVILIPLGRPHDWGRENYGVGRFGRGDFQRGRSGLSWHRDGTNQRQGWGDRFADRVRGRPYPQADNFPHRAQGRMNDHARVGEDQKVEPTGKEKDLMIANASNDENPMIQSADGARNFEVGESSVNPIDEEKMAVETTGHGESNKGSSNLGDHGVDLSGKNEKEEDKNPDILVGKPHESIFCHTCKVVGHYTKEYRRVW
jgi:hypothetical protein